MTSTFLNYRIYSANMAKSQQRVAAEPQNATDQKYFEANIGKVKSVDDFLNNFRLFTYAMKAYGLQDLGNAKALMKQVLTSDLSDTNSVANRLNDSRYKAFAKAFNFTTTGAVASTGQLQTSAQREDLLNKMNVANMPTATGDDLESRLSAVTSVDSLESDTTLYRQVLTAYGLDPNTTLKSSVTLALESDLSSPFSFANRLDNAKFRPLAEAFNFSKSGTIGGQKLMQSAPNIAAAQAAYLKAVPSAASSQAAAQTENAYYAQKMPTFTSVDQITGDSRIVSYLKTAYGLDKNMTALQLRGVLTSNLLDPKSSANTFLVDPKTPSTTPTPYQRIAAAFSIGTDGTAWDHSSTTTALNLTAMTKAYTASKVAAAGANSDAIAAAQKAADAETLYFKSNAPDAASVSDLLGDTRLLAYIRTAFNLPDQKTTTSPTTGLTTTTGTSLTDLANILKSNLLDPTSAANTLGANARKLAASFNFAPNGLVYSQRSIQSDANVTATTKAYQSQAGTVGGAKAAAQAETDYFTSTLPRVKSVDDLLGNKRLVAYITTAYNIPTNTLKSTLRQVLTSDLLDPKSVANKLGGAFQTLAAAFDISSDGTITHPADQQVQTKSGIAATHNAYLEEAMESEAGDNQGDGVRLALYFKRVAPTITSAYGILADKALTSVVQTMLGLSTSSSNADIDSQARTISSKIKIADFQDPQKLEKLVARFAALYDLKNSSSSSSSGSSNPVLSLFS